MTSRRRPLDELPGYVYVIAFSNGVIKVGRTQDTRDRLGEHKRTAKSFGISIDAQWESPRHDGWIENEQALMQLAAELGGTATTPEYFTGVDFEALASRARELPFPSGKSDAASAVRPGNRIPGWFRKERSIAAKRIAAGWYDREGVLEWFVDEIIRSDKEFARLIVGQYVRKSLAGALKRGRPAPPAAPPEPEPPEPACMGLAA